MMGFRWPHRAPALGFCALTCLALAWQQAQAAILLEVTPATSIGSVGSQVSVEVGISDQGTVLIGGYEINFGWDEEVLRLASIAFGTSLGGPQDSIQDFVAGLASLNVAETSLAFDLGSLQDGSPFALFDLTFDLVGIGNSSLTLSPGAGSTYLLDDLGQPITDVATINGSVAAVPVAAPWYLMLLGLWGIRVSSRRRR
jgi:hypothetical protein